MNLILHITTRAEWDAADPYCPGSLAREGFIHCSTPSQAVATANRYFRGRGDLVLLCIDPARVADALRYEPPAPPAGALPTYTTDERFPHVYSPLAREAVVAVVAFPCDTGGGFTLPALPEPPQDR